jgi:hypothetical protein
MFMKKVLFVALFVASGFIAANAQEGFKFGAGVNVGLPVGDAGDISSFTVGGELQGEYKFSANASVVATTGYTHFIGKDFEGFKFSYGAVPILAGARYYPSAKFFVGGQIGYGFFTGDASGGGFAYKPQIGYDAGSAEIALGYNAITDDGATISWIGLSAIFNFGAAKK